MITDWCKDPTVESKLKSLGAKYRVVRGVLVDTIDLEVSLKNNARLNTPYNEELAVEYAIAYEQGDKFPMVILQLIPGVAKRSKQYRILSGNHRCGACAIAGRLAVDAYVLEGQDEQMADVVTRSANRWMGDRQSKEEAVEHVQILISRYSMTHKDAARLFGLTLPWLHNALRAEAVRGNLEKLLVDSRSMTRGTLIKIGLLDYNDKLLRKAGHLATRFGMPQNRVSSMVAEVKTATNEADALTILKKWDSMLTDEKPKSGVAGTKLVEQSKFRRHMNTLLHFVNSGRKGKAFESLRQLKITNPEDRKETRNIWKEVRGLIDELFRADACQETSTKRNRNTATTKNRRKRT